MATSVIPKSLASDYTPYYYRAVHIDQSITLNAFAAINLGEYVLPYRDIQGYTFINYMGGKGNGNVGLVFNPGTVWVFNGTNETKTWQSFDVYILYTKNI